MRRKTPDFLPRDALSGGSFPWVVAVMVYLSTLAAGLAIFLHLASGALTGDLERRFFIEIAAGDETLAAAEATAVEQRLQAIPAVRDLHRLSREEIDRLLAPWLGHSADPAELPLPIIIEFILAPGNDDPLKILEAALADAAPHARILSQQDWIAALGRFARALQLAAILAITLLISATAALVIFGARAEFLTHREALSLVHLLGAEDRTIAAVFRHRFAREATMGALIGTLMALISLLALGMLAGEVGEGLLMPQGMLRSIWWLALTAPPLLALVITILTVEVAVRQALGTWL